MKTNCAKRCACMIRTSTSASWTLSLGRWALIAFLLQGLCNAQDYLTSTGAPSFAAPYPVEMGFVDAASGNLHLEIPLAGC